MRDDENPARAADRDLASRDVVSGGREARKRRRWPIVVLVALVVLAVLATWGDHRQRGREFDALASRAADAQASVRIAADAVVSTRAYTMPLLVSSSSVTVRAGLARLIDDAAARGETSVREERAALARVDVLSWHDKMRNAKALALAYLDQRIADLDFVAHGGDLAALDSPAAAAAAARAAHAFHEAAPSNADAARAEQIFATPSA